MKTNMGAFNVSTANVQIKLCWGNIVSPTVTDTTAPDATPE